LLEAPFDNDSQKNMIQYVVSGEYYLMMKDAFFYKAIGPADKDKEKFCKIYSKVCFLDFLTSAAVTLNDGLPEKQGFYEDVFSAHTIARGTLFSGLVLNSFNENIFPLLSIR